MSPKDKFKQFLSIPLSFANATLIKHFWFHTGSYYIFLLAFIVHKFDANVDFGFKFIKEFCTSGKPEIKKHICK